jgi:hypothetical protein
VLGWFGELAARRTAGLSPNPISYVEIEAWARLTGRRPRPFEVHLITKLDDAAQERAAKRAQERAENHGELPAGEGGPAVAALMTTLGKPKKGKKGEAPSAGADKPARRGKRENAVPAEKL